MQEAILKLIEGLTMLAAILVTRYVIPWVKSHTSAEQLRMAQLIIDAAVLSAQQTMGEEEGSTKKATVKARVLSELDARGIYVTENQLNDLIEAAVKAMKTEEAKAK